MSYHWIELTPSSNPVDIPDAVVEKAFGSLAEHAQLADGSRLMIDPQLPFESPGFKPPQADQHTMQFELLLAAFQSKIWKKIQALRCSRNLISPIYRLPSEVLIDIFLLVHDYTQRKNDYKALHQMAQVCCAWRDIILSNPCFWTYVSVQLPLSMNKQIIKLSKNAPLHTDLRYWKDVDVEKSILLECLVQEVSRWKGVICNNDQMVNMMDQMVQEGVATTLEYFQWTRSPLSNCEVPSLIQERAPRLRELEIMGLPLVPLDLPILSRIKVLRFTPSSDMLQSHTHWERLLSCIPEIETMETSASPRSLPKWTT
ncbi:hypothetical protein FRC03_006613 [Tulasnella sp. 419]|nr:hypothetical protein FRC03_006613 [Tulasnella sp. 419]